MTLTSGGTNDWVMFVLSLGKSLLMLSSPLLLDFFATSPPPQGYQHTVFVYRFGSNCQFHLCLYFLTSPRRWNSFLRIRGAPPGWMMNPRGQWWSFEIGCFASHPWRNFSRKHFCFHKPTYIPVPKSLAVHIKAGTQGFLTERHSFTSWSLLFPPLLDGFNVVAVDFHFNPTEKNCSDCQSEHDVNLK